ncbi:MAG: hypothetical protein ACPGWS_09695 [Solirubrobacterales bacterium]
MSFAVIVPGGEQVILEDLPLELLAEIEKDGGTRWPTVLAAPASSAMSALAAYKVACKHAGVEPEDMTARRILEGEVFVQVDDDLPTLFEDGLPKAEDDPTTSGSSTASTDTDGPQT